MVYVAWFFRIVIFLLLLGFAIKNSDPVTLNYYLNYQWRAPLVLILVVFLLLGVLIGLLAASGTIFRQKRQIQALRREAELHAKAARPADVAPDLDHRLL